jgi:hypothetical protein
MKSHESLIPLSRDHHGALILARLIQKGAPAYNGLPMDIAGKMAYAVKFYEQELISHFLLEENGLIGKIKGINKKIDVLSDEILYEHKELRLLFELLSVSEKPEEHLDILGYALEKHIRKEEREWFPLIQEHCSETLLAEVAGLLTH